MRYNNAPLRHPKAYSQLLLASDCAGASLSCQLVLRAVRSIGAAQCNAISRPGSRQWLGLPLPKHACSCVQARRQFRELHSVNTKTSCAQARTAGNQPVRQATASSCREINRQHEQCNIPNKLAVEAMQAGAESKQPVRKATTSSCPEQDSTSTRPPLQVPIC